MWCRPVGWDDSPRASVTQQELWRQLRRIWKWFRRLHCQLWWLLLQRRLQAGRGRGIKKAAKNNSKLWTAGGLDGDGVVFVRHNRDSNSWHTSLSWEAKKRQWLWPRGQSSRSQRSTVRIHSSAIFYIEHLFSINCIKKAKITRKRGREWPFYIDE